MQAAALWNDVPYAEKREISVSVCRYGDGTELVLNFLAARGVADGPTLLVFGGVHGDEFEGPQALWRFFEQLDPNDFEGTFVAAPLCNPPAFEAGMRVNPADPKDLARVFPGSPSGTATEQIAFLLHHRAIAHADFFLDMHSSGRNYRIDPWVGYVLVDDETTLRTQREAAQLVGYPTVWGKPVLPGRTIWSAAEHNVPALYVEAPGEGRAEPEDVERNITALKQLMRFLRMVDEQPVSFEPARAIEESDPQAGHLQGQLVTRNGGYFEAKVHPGDQVERGAVIGTVSDVHGRTLDEVRSLSAGRVIFLRTFPIVAPGDSVGSVLPVAR